MTSKVKLFTDQEHKQIFIFDGTPAELNLKPSINFLILPKVRRRRLLDEENQLFINYTQN